MTRNLGVTTLFCSVIWFLTLGIHLFLFLRVSTHTDHFTPISWHPHLNVWHYELESNDPDYFTLKTKTLKIRVDSLLWCHQRYHLTLSTWPCSIDAPVQFLPCLMTLSGVFVTRLCSVVLFQFQASEKSDFDGKKGYRNGTESFCLFLESFFLTTTKICWTGHEHQVSWHCHLFLDILLVT